MRDVLCIYYSRTGNTKRVMETIAKEMDAELLALTDGVERSGLRGWLRSGMDAMKLSTKPLNPFETARPLEEYKLVIVGSPVWAGRMASPIRSLLKRRGLELHRVAYVVTRSTEQRSEEVYDQLDLYTAEKRLFAVSLRPGSEGYEFWRNDFVQNVQRWLEQN